MHEVTYLHDQQWHGPGSVLQLPDARLLTLPGVMTAKGRRLEAGDAGLAEGVDGDGTGRIFSTSSSYTVSTACAKTPLRVSGLKSAPYLCLHCHCFLLNALSSALTASGNAAS